ncbi:sulfatase [Haloferula sp. BvORR071]|uniref:sulfatase n=1 Tax=Haloferula sp. BvORR071 TaxID=1396141 RepID=UPI00054EB0F9|nr:sulfatase [Haloferula sp. BvORR071]
MKAVLSIFVAFTGLGSAADHPNLLVFLVDDMGAMDTSVPFSSSGSELNQRYHTPHMQELADRGMKFMRAYAHPVCTPSRVSIMTGKNAARHHVTNWTTPDGADGNEQGDPHLAPPQDWLRKGMAASEKPLPALLKAAGYQTIHCGKAHFGSKGTFAADPKGIGFDVNIAGSEIGHPASYFAKKNFGDGRNHVTGLDQWNGTDGFLTDVLTKELCSAIETASKQDKPFFAYMAHYAVHSPFQENPRFGMNYPNLSPPQRAYASMIEGMDRSLGDILTKLEQLGIAQNTFVIFLSDNGGDAPIPNDRTNPIASGNAPLRGKKGMRYEGGIRVPMIAAWAKPDATNPLQASLSIKPGSSTNDIVHVTDLFPTLLGLAGAKDVPVFEGADLRPYLRGDESYHRPQWLVTHYPHAHNNEYFSILHEGTWKLIHNYVDGSLELYDLAKDPYEQNNLAKTEPERSATMAKTLDQHLTEYGAQMPEQVK